ncbi:acyltransferase family protein [Pseudomonas putida]|uniref:acyltransferase family protein n=1 Tax=Pseudomonas putida TaxID=303 RepID=UPI003D975A16
MSGSNVKNFSTRLESLRGLAAICVAVGHSLIWLRFISEPAIWAKSVFDVNGIQATLTRALITIFSGAAAVDIFFVLSGYVLAKSISRRPNSLPAIFEYSVKRMLRIVPAFWASLALAVLCLLAFSTGYVPKEGGTIWFNGWYREPLSLSVIASNVFMQTPSLNPNSWTLTVEVLGSLLLPFLLMFGWRKGLASTIAMLAVAIAISAYGSYFGLTWSYYFFMFAAGVAAAKHGDAVVSLLKPKVAKLTGIVAIFFILAGSAFFPLVHVLPQDILFVVGAAWLVMLLGSSAIPEKIAILDNPVSRFVGRISYSFYLLHFMVLYWTANAVFVLVPDQFLIAYPLPVMIVVASATVILVLPLSWLSYMYVERPFIYIGNAAFDNSRRRVASL